MYTNLSSLILKGLITNREKNYTIFQSEKIIYPNYSTIKLTPHSILIKYNLMSGLNAQEKQLLRVASFEVSWISGNAIAEACRMKKVDLYCEILRNYMKTVDSSDFNELSNRCVLPLRDSKLSLFRELMKQGAKEGKFCWYSIFFSFDYVYVYYSHSFLGKTIWEKYKNLKSLLLNHCNHHFSYKSGENLNDALLRCKTNLMLYKHNKLIAAKNKRNLVRNPIYEAEPEAVLSDMEASTFTPEHLVFLGSYDKPIFSVPRLAKSHVYSDSDEEGNVLRNNGDLDGATGPSTSSTSTSKVSEKRSNASIVTQFPSRKIQKLDAKKTLKYNESRAKNDESIQRNEMLKMQSEAHLAVGKSQILKTNMEFMRLAMEFDLPNLEEIKNATVQSFFAQNNIAAPTTNICNDSCVLTTPSPTRRASNINQVVIEKNNSPPDTTNCNRITNSDGEIPMNQPEFGESSSDNSIHDENFALTSRSSLDESNKTEEV